MNHQRRAAKFIPFAIRQANEAEEFGFTRNECCRNLKIAIHQYWQNKVLGHHGQAHKSQIPRSVAASGLPLKDCVVEHVVPQMEIVNTLMDLRPLTEQGVIDILSRLLRVVLVTKEEHVRLNASGYRSCMPADWDGVDPFARYSRLGIKVQDPAAWNIISRDA